MDVSIIIPVYNSEQNLSELNRQLVDALSSFSFEIIMVNDQSRDNSWNVIAKLAEENAKIVGVNLRKNSGQDNAIMAGLTVAKGDYMVIMDDDLQHSPYDIPKLIAACSKGYDLCFANFPEIKQAFWKNCGSRFNGKVAEVLIEKPANVYLSPFKVMRREVAKEIVKYDGPFPYVDGLLFSVTRNIIQIPVEHHKRFQGQSNYSLRKSIQVFMKLATSFSILPLQIASVIGFFSAFTGFFLGIYYLVQFFVTRNQPEGWTSIIFLVLIMGGLILISLGLIGEYLGRMYLTVNHRPQYTIKEIIIKRENK